MKCIDLFSVDQLNEQGRNGELHNKPCGKHVGGEDLGTLCSDQQYVNNLT